MIVARVVFHTGSIAHTVCFFEPVAAGQHRHEIPQPNFRPPKTAFRPQTLVGIFSDAARFLGVLLRLLRRGGEPRKYYAQQRRVVIMPQ